ncbi:nucleotide pyrophosphohydrolase [Asanoa sp. NPDC049518]|uniref:nucleotide pyrophosphohydrolase n=1 Tax=unclassified Asanoa TaxID=2685164 RepID=UPI0034312A4D
MDHDLAALTARLAAFADERDWDQFHTPKNLVMALAGEVGELTAEFQWLTAAESETVLSDEQRAERVRAEIGDVMIYLTRLAGVLDIDLVAAANAKLDDAARRYPAERVRGSADKARSRPVE